MSSYNSFQACQLSACRSHILQLPAIWFLVAIAPWDEQSTTSWPWALDSGASQPDHGIQWNSKQFSIPSEIIKMVPGDLQRPPKWGPNRCQKPSKSTKSQKHKTKKTNVFGMFLRGLDITNQQIFKSKIIKIRACNPTMLFDSSNYGKCQKVLQNSPKRGPNIYPKSSKIQPGTPQGPFGCICALSDHQNSAKMVPKGSQMELKRCSKDPENIIKSTKMQSQTIQQKANIFDSFPLIPIQKIFLQVLQTLQLCKSPIRWLPGGPAAGAKP